MLVIFVVLLSSQMATTLERQNIDLEGEQARLEAGNKEAAKTFQRLTDLVQKDRKTIEENEYIIIEQKREIENLNIEKTRLENIIDSIQLNNETYVRYWRNIKKLGIFYGKLTRLILS